MDADPVRGDLGAYWRAIARGRAFHVQTVAREQRSLAIQRVEREVQRLGGDILDCKLFSNLSLALVVELTGGGVAALADALSALGWHVEVEPDRAALAGQADARLEGTVQVTFPEGDGGLVIPLPAVPG